MKSKSDTPHALIPDNLIDYTNNDHLAACARKLDDSLRPIIERMLIARGLTLADLPALVRKFMAEREAGKSAC